MRYLTKSRFKLAMECPTKLYYTGKKEYANKQDEDSFLASLAEGGLQIGELATAYYPGGHNITTLDHEAALHQTNELLKQENVVIFEAAIKYENFFIRVDILEKKGHEINLIEVKSSSVDGSVKNPFEGKRGGILTKWKPYLYDITFQYYVAKKSLGEYKVKPYLMLVDKNAEAPTDTLNQKFRIKKDEQSRAYVKLTESLSEIEQSKKILVKKETSKISDELIKQTVYPYLGESFGFEDLINEFAQNYKKDQLIPAQISSACKNCEFRANPEEMKQGLKSGYHECFKRSLDWEEKDFKEDMIFDLRKQTNLDKLIAEKKIKFSDLTFDDVGLKSEEFKNDQEAALSPAERRALQLEKSKNKDDTPYINKLALRKLMSEWTYPLHFIDFETAQPVIPLNKGAKPYELVAFQFSHHIVYEDGTIEHKSEYLNTEVGVNPNVDFVRALKRSLGDKGTIFRYSHHENTVLIKIAEQLEHSKADFEDKEELIEFIKQITVDRKQKIVGERNMVDLCDLVEKYYFDPYMKGSTSIKAVLPAILKSSSFIQEKYSQPIYGSNKGIKSLNFKDKVWVKYQNNQVIDPYQQLPKLFSDVTDKEHELIQINDELNNGSAAMTAYERLQFEDIPDSVRTEIESGLLKYCELDTLAMVFIYEAWVDMVN